MSPQAPGARVMEPGCPSAPQVFWKKLSPLRSDRLRLLSTPPRAAVSAFTWVSFQAMAPASVTMDSPGVSEISTVEKLGRWVIS